MTVKSPAYRVFDEAIGHFGSAIWVLAMDNLVRPQIITGLNEAAYGWR